MDFVEWDKDLATAWYNRTGPRVSVAQHNSAMVLAASIMDILVQPAIVAPQGATRVAFPKTLYHGPIADADGTEVPLVGSLELNPADLGDDPSSPALMRARAWQALDEALRRVSLVDYADTGATTPAGELDDVYPHGVVGVDGEAAAALVLTLDPTAQIQEPTTADDLANVLKLTIPIAKAIAAASMAGTNLEAAATNAVSTWAGANAASAQSIQDRAVLLRTAGSKHAKDAMTLAIWLGSAFVALTGIGALIKKRKPGYWRQANQLVAGGKV